MSYSSGTFSLFTPGNPVVTGTTIASTWANNTLNDVATGLSTCVLKDGSQTITANIPMSSFKITGLGAPTTAGDALAFGSAGTVTTLTATTSVVTTLVTGGAADISIQGSGAATWNLNAGGTWQPGADNTQQIGATNKRVSQVVTPIIDSGTTGALSLKTNNGTAQVTIANSGTTGIGGATPAATGKGITFPASQSASSDANTLDDYAEGTWTPSVGGSATYTTQAGSYTKIGRLLFFEGTIVINAIGTGSTTILSGLPVPSAANGRNTAVYVVNTSSLATSVVSIAGFVGTNGTQITFESRTAAATSDTNNAIFGNGTQVTVSGCYQTS